MFNYGIKRGIKGLLKNIKIRDKLIYFKELGIICYRDNWSYLVLVFNILFVKYIY